MGGVGSRDKPGEHGSLLKAAGLPDRLDPLDPAAATIGLGAALDLAHQHDVANGPLAGVVGRVDLSLRDVGEGPERLVLVQEASGEARRAGVTACGALFEQLADLNSQRREPGGEPLAVAAVLEIS